MENTVYVAVSRQLGVRREMDLIANNIANANTPAFKAERLVFREYLNDGTQASDVSFVQDMGTARDLDPGNLVSTNNDTDVAIPGEGYFVIDTPQGERYTRHGRFELDVQGRLVNSVGQPVQGTGGDITIPQNTAEIVIAGDGSVKADDAVVGQLRLVTFSDEQGLRKAANGLYDAPPEIEVRDVDQPTVVQGMIEQSNVVPILEMTRMMSVARINDSVSRMLQREDEKVKDMITKVGTPVNPA